MTSQPDNGSGTLGENMPDDFDFHIASRSLPNSPKFDDERQRDMKALASVKARRGDTIPYATLRAHLDVTLQLRAFLHPPILAIVQHFKGVRP